MSGLHVILISLGAVGLVLILIAIVPDVWIDHRLSLKEPGTIQDTGDFRLAAKEYENLEWPYYLYADTWRSRRYLEWRPFVYWRRAGYESPYVYVNERGLRRTWLAKQDNRQPYNIFMFGGSTMWGFGARDSHTIASELAKLLANKSIRNVRVTNFGEAGYVLTQEVFTFFMELQRGNRPDSWMVIMMWWRPRSTKSRGLLKMKSIAGGSSISSTSIIAINSVPNFPVNYFTGPSDN
ncbi:MAG: hypothetical protein VB959_13880 [Rhodospirillales bacterium]